MNIPLVTFSAPLLRLILCGCPGLAPAWGPLADADGALCSWHPYRGEVFVSGDYTTTDPALDAGSWSITLDEASPWPARLAMVAAWIGRGDKQRMDGASVVDDLGWLRLYSLSDGLLYEQVWDLDDGGNIEPGAMRLDLPTLPQHLQTHPPAVALLLALYDVPEIRARVESA